MIKKIIISVLHIMKLLLSTHEHFNVVLLPLDILSIFFLVQDIFYLYYVLTLQDARKHLLIRKKTMYYVVSIILNIIPFGYLYTFALFQELILLLFIFLLVLFHRLSYKPSLAEFENLDCYSDLSLGYGSALCYYHNYLNYILGDARLNLITRIRMFKSKQRIDKMSHKLFILIPSSCKDETYIDESRFISRCSELISFELNIAGISQRTYNITVYHVRCVDDPENSFRLALEYAQPLKALFSLKEKGLLSIADMYKQRDIFTKSLKEMLIKSRNWRQVCLVEYDDEHPSYELSEVLRKVEDVYEYRHY